jgi:hypothetical protein
VIECHIPQRRVEEDDDERVHVFPIIGREHERSLECWCWPSYNECDCIVMHNVEH